MRKFRVVLMMVLAAAATAFGAPRMVGAIASSTVNATARTSAPDSAVRKNDVHANDVQANDVRSDVQANDVRSEVQANEVQANDVRSKANSATAIAAPASSPQIFFSDLISGPGAGGENGQGVLVTIWGRGFGASQGGSTVTVAGVPAANYPIWADNKITFQINSMMATGNIVVNLPTTGASNGLPFIIRGGRIRFVATTGNDANDGSFLHPWRTLSFAVDTIFPGDVVYAMNGVSQTTLHRSGAALALTNAGTWLMPKSLLAYPRAIVTVGDPNDSSVPYGLFVPDTVANASYWVFSGIVFRGFFSALTISANPTNSLMNSWWRVVGNDFSCPNGSGTGACLQAARVSAFALLGNQIHDSGSLTSLDLKNYQHVLFGEGSRSIEVGWNEIARTRSCVALRFYSSIADEYDLNIHHNLIHDSVCDGIDLASVNPTTSAVSVHDNVVYHAGTGPAPGGVEASYACLSIAGGGTVPASIFNNTLYDCGKPGTANAGALSIVRPVSLINNIVGVSGMEIYFTSQTQLAFLQGSNNLMSGGGEGPIQLSSRKVGDPIFVDAQNHNFRLQAGSPAIDAGIATPTKMDFDGIVRQQGAAYDVGAFEFAAPLAGGLLSPNPSTINFGVVPLATSSTQNVTLTNSGSVLVTISQMTVRGTGLSAAGITPPVSLAPGQSLSFPVTFSPLASGAVSGTVSLVSNAANSTSVITMNGSGAAAGQLTASPSSVNFGNIVLKSSVTQTITLTNATGAGVSITQANITGAGFSSGLTLPATLATGQSLAFPVNFMPSVAGPVSGTLSLVTNAAGSPSLITLAGAGVAQGQLTASPSSLGFGSVVLNSNASQSVMLTNSGGAGVTITQANITGVGFSSGLALPVTIAAGQSLSVPINFRPLASAAVSGSLSLVSNAMNSPATIMFTGSGVAPGQLTPNPASISFGSVLLNTTVSKTLTLTNTGGVAVTITQANLTGVGFSSASLTLPLTLAPGQSIAIQPNFTPTLAGSVTGNLSLVNNSPASPLNVPWNGVGIAPPVHSVDVAWDPSVSTVQGYNSYRASVSGGPYTKMNPAIITGVAFTDGSVTSGQTYFYVITSVDAAGTESAYSGEVAAVVP